MTFSAIDDETTNRRSFLLTTIHCMAIFIRPCSQNSGKLRNRHGRKTMEEFTQEESARIRSEMRKRRGIIHVWPDRIAFLSTRNANILRRWRIEKKRRAFLIMRRRLLASGTETSHMKDQHSGPLVGKAMPYNRCFPPKEALSHEGNTLPRLYNGSLIPPNYL